MRNTALVPILLGAAWGDDGPSTRPDAPPQPDAPADAPPDAPAMVMQMVDRAGGTVALPGGDATITIPPDAIDRPTMITLEASSAAPSAGALSPVYKLGPDGQVFAHPVTVTLALPAGASAADVYWSSSNGARLYEHRRHGRRRQGHRGDRALQRGLRGDRVDVAR